MTLKGTRLPNAADANENELALDELARDLDDRLSGETDPGALTDSSGGSTDGTVEAVSGSGADTAINNNFAELTTIVNALRTILVNAGIAE